MADLRDPHSHSRPDEVRVRHLSLELDVDFHSRRLTGRAVLDVERAPGATELVLDTWGLEIGGVRLDDGSAAPYSLGDADPVLGSALTVELGDADRVVVDYTTSPDARAVQWLEETQTDSGERFLFTQSEAILARSWVPIQDSPAVRFTYDAVVRVPDGFLALMSAEQVEPTAASPEGEYRFTMPQPIPSYLLALAVGRLEFRSLGERTGVYAEPSVVERAAWELADTEAMMQAAEDLYGPYRWGRYDLLVLPPSFPFGGMENPRITFATPTILAGDRSLVALVAHELAHSWSGNLVTNATWDDFWLNEGFTVYFEIRILEQLYGEEHAAMVWRLSRQDLEVELTQVPPADTALRLDLSGRDPDDGVSPIAYDKGALFLRLLEEAAGRERFDAFLRSYFDTFAFRSMTTDGFLEVLERELLAPAGLSAEELQVAAWVDGPGVPDNAPVVASTAFDAVDRQLAELGAGHPADGLATDGWVTQQWLHFVRGLPADLEDPRLAEIDRTFRFSESGNAEVLCAWLTRALDWGLVFRDPRVEAALERFLVAQGRRKFLKPLYERLVRTPEGTTLATRIYAAARPGYHAVARGTVDPLVGPPS